jgi:rubrerythrin
MSDPDDNFEAEQLIGDPHDWKCPECGYPNHGEDDKCFDCGQERNSEPETWQLAAIALAGKTGP